MISYQSLEVYNIMNKQTIKTTYYFYVEILFYFKQASKYLFTATVTGSTLNVILSFFFIPKWGILGAILANAISMLLRVLIVVFISKRFADVGLCIKDFILNFFTVAAFITIGLAFSYCKYSDSFNVLNFAFKILVVLTYIFYVFFKFHERLFALLPVLREKIRNRF